MERNGNGPKKLCFGNFPLENGECNSCSDKADCWDDQAGWGISRVTIDSEALQQIEQQLGGVPDWVFEWDELSEEELNKLKLEEPERFRIYSLLNSAIQD